MLEVEKLIKRFDGLTALNDLSFQVPEATITAIVGPNGSGKTTLFNVIIGLLRADEGRIAFKGDTITQFATYKIVQKGIGRTFQMIRIFPQITVLENMLLALEQPVRERLFFSLNPFVRYDDRPLKKKAVEILSFARLDDKINEYAGNLSHGQRRLLEILRALALDADLYLFDEPTAGVFPETREKILALFKELQAQQKTIMFIEHNLDAVVGWAERVIVLDRGKIIADGEPRVTLENEAVVRAYFGG